MVCNGMLKRCSAIALLLFSGLIATPAITEAATRGYHPGHYVALNRWESDEAKVAALQYSGVKGGQVRYQWKELETSFDTYDFSLVEHHLSLAKSQGRRLVIIIVDKTFFNNEKATPAYLHNKFTVANKPGGWTSVRWAPYVVTRYNKLLRRLGERFDSDPYFEGVSFQESAHGIPDATLAALDYTPEKYRDALINMLGSAATHFPSSQVFWFMNFLEGKTPYIVDIAEAVAPLGVAMGGPDILPDDYHLNKQTYSFYEQFKDRMTLFGSVQNNSYRHLHADKSRPTKYWTPKELFFFARDQLHVNYVFWNRPKEPNPADSYYWVDALPIIRNYPNFGGSGSDAGGYIDTDADGLSDGKEKSLGTSVWNPDTDGDTLSDGDEVNNFGTNPLARNTDADGINDNIEIFVKGTDPLNPDTDNDGLTDGDEASNNGIGTDPLDPDTDNGGTIDGIEVAIGTDPMKKWDDADTKDSDGDKLSDSVELSIGTGIWKRDTDGDTLNDYDEVMVYGTDPLARNTDKDLINDNFELARGLDPLNPDSDFDGLSDGEEASRNGIGTDPLNPDSDGDGVSDGVEVARGKDPLNPYKW